MFHGSALPVEPSVVRGAVARADETSGRLANDVCGVENSESWRCVDEKLRFPRRDSSRTGVVLERESERELPRGPWALCVRRTIEDDPGADACPGVARLVDAKGKEEPSAATLRR